MNKVFYGSKIIRKLIISVVCASIASFVLAIGFSVLLLRPRLEQDAIQNATRMSNEITRQVNQVFSNMSDYAAYMTKDMSLERALDIYYETPTAYTADGVTNILTNSQSITSFIRAVELEAATGEQFFSRGALADEDWELLQSTWYQSVLSGNAAHVWSSFYTASLEEPTYTLLYVYLTEIAGKRYALSIFYRADELIDTINTLAKEQYSGYLITDHHDMEEGKPFWEIGTVGNAETISSDLSLTGHVKDQAGYYFISDISLSGWSIIGFIDCHVFQQQFLPIYLLTFLTCLILCLSVSLLIAAILGHVLSPIGALKRTMNTVAEGDRTARVHVQTNDELGQLGNAFNQMLDQLNSSMERQLAMEEEEQRMKYQLLIAQIDTHFLYNSLSIINSFARKQKYAEIIQTNSALTRILQHNLRSSEVSAMSPVREEISVVNSYWTIEKMRSNNLVQLEWNVDPSLLERMIPQHLIQPLVENSLRHGLFNPETGMYVGTIWVTIQEQSSNLTIYVKDNGCGIPQELLHLLNSGDAFSTQSDETRHIGLENIRRRLSYLYGNFPCMNVTSENGTTVVLCLPPS